MKGTVSRLLFDLGRGAPVTLEPVGGGCIAAAAIARFADGSEVFVKAAEGAPGLFVAEADGLRALAEAGAIRVPGVLAVGEGALVLERIREGSRPADFFERFGRALAALHGHRGPACGFHRDNWIGATLQPNVPLRGGWPGWEQGETQAARGDGNDWPEFFVERRLRFQCKLAAERGATGLLSLLDRAEPRIHALLAAAPEPPSLLHGDLWGGNFLTDETGDPVLIDPAVYYGHREADLAMTRLFGGFAPAFHGAYDEALPLAPGYAEREPAYQLYHVLNHFNLFGGGYLAQAERILQRYR